MEGDSAELRLGARLGRKVNPQLGKERGPSENLGTNLCHPDFRLPISRMREHEALLSFATRVLDGIRVAHSQLILSGS